MQQVVSSCPTAFCTHNNVNKQLINHQDFDCFFKTSTNTKLSPSAAFVNLLDFGVSLKTNKTRHLTPDTIKN